MIRSTSNESGMDERALFCATLCRGAEAMNALAAEAREEELFLKNPNFRWDAVHVAAVACRVRDELEQLRKQPGKVWRNSVSTGL